MNQADHERTVEMIQLGVHQYFDHYLTDIFPGQMGRLFASHNQDAEAHDPRIEIHVGTCKVAKKVNRMLWMISGGAMVLGVAGTLVAEHIGAILKALLG
jgi:hypothetical protein